MNSIDDIWLRWYAGLITFDWYRLVAQASSSDALLDYLKIKEWKKKLVKIRFAIVTEKRQMKISGGTSWCDCTYSLNSNIDNRHTRGEFKLSKKLFIQFSNRSINLQRRTEKCNRGISSLSRERGMVNGSERWRALDRQFFSQWGANEDGVTRWVKRKLS